MSSSQSSTQDMEISSQSSLNSSFDTAMVPTQPMGEVLSTNIIKEQMMKSYAVVPTNKRNRMTTTNSGSLILRQPGARQSEGLIVREAVSGIHELCTSLSQSIAENTASRKTAEENVSKVIQLAQDVMENSKGREQAFIDLIKGMTTKPQASIPNALGSSVVPQPFEVTQPESYFVPSAQPPPLPLPPRTMTMNLINVSLSSLPPPPSSSQRVPSIPPQNQTIIRRQALDRSKEERGRPQRTSHHIPYDTTPYEISGGSDDEISRHSSHSRSRSPVHDSEIQPHYHSSSTPRYHH